MKKNPHLVTAGAPLRRHAENRLRGQSGPNGDAHNTGQSTADTQRLLHELQVHQVELEMQNEELRKARDEMEAGLEKYSELYDFAPVGYLTLDRGGAIQEANLAAASLLGVSRALLVNHRLRNSVVPAGRLSFDAFLHQIFEVGDRKECELQLLVKGRPPVDVRIRANRFALGEACRLAVSDITKHKLAEAATTQLAAIVNASSDAIIGKDLNGIVTSWNPGAERIFGYAPAEIVGASIARLIPSERQPEEAQIMSRIRKGESVEHFETVRVAKDGRRLDISVAISPVRQADGKIVGASKVARDVTGQKQAADSLRVSELRYRRLFEAAKDGILILDPATRKITDANPFIVKLLGFSQKQLLKKELWQIGLLKDEASNRSAFRELKSKGFIRYEDLPLKSKNGKEHQVEFVSNLYFEGGQAVIQCNVRDITVRKHAEDALRRNEAIFTALIDQAPMGVYIVDAGFRMVQINPKALPAFNKIHPLIGRDFGQILNLLWPRGAAASLVALFRHTLRTGEAYQSPEFAERRRDTGKEEVYDFQLQRITLPGGEHGVVCFFNDISARRKADQDLRWAQTQLATYASQLENMVTTRTAQLTAANRQLETSDELNRKGKEEFKGLFEESLEMQKKLRRLTHQILTAQEEERKKISRELHDEVVQTLVGLNVELSGLVHGNSAGVRNLKDKIANAQRLVESSVEAVHRFARDLRPTVLDDLGLIPALHAFCVSLARRKKFKIKMTVSRGVEALSSDKRTVLFRVAQEALNNVARHARASRVKLTIAKVPGAILMKISDNGKSFAVKKILVAKNNKRLGLVGMKERVEMVGGRLTIESALGRGTTVSAEIPFLASPENKNP